MVTPEHHKALSKAKIGVMTKPNSVFWSVAMMGLRHEFDESVPTAGTNGIWVKYNPTWFMDIPDLPKKTGLCFHETAHVVLMHPIRGEGKDQERYNAAGDYYINLMAVKAGYEIPDGGLLDWKYDGMSTDEIYDALPEDFKAPDKMMKDIMPGDGEATPMTAEQVRQVDDLLVRAVMASKAAGEDPGAIPGEVEEYVNNLLYPTISWFSIFKRYMKRFDKSDYTIMKPNRRFFPEWILPGLHGEAIGNIAEAMDVSGSVGSVELQHYTSETDGIFRQLKPEKLTLIQFDTRITKVETITQRDELKRLKFRGRGGTSINPVMQWAKDNKPDVMVVFSDGHFSPATINPRVPVVWVINNNRDFTAPFGKVIHFTLEL